MPLRKVLYLGLQPPYKAYDGEIIHYPIICTVPRKVVDPSIKKVFQNFNAYTHLVITSKTVLPLLFTFAKDFGISNEEILGKQLIAVGRATAAAATRYNMQAIIPTEEESAEGMVKMMKNLDLSKAHLFWPHSALSRPILTGYFEQHSISYCDCIFYDTMANHLYPKPDIGSVDEIVFTSPSTVDAYLKLVGPIPSHKKITAIGPVTAAYLNNSI